MVYTKKIIQNFFLINLLRNKYIYMQILKLFSEEIIFNSANNGTW